MTFNLQKLLGKTYNFGSILHNQIFLYVVLAMSIINVVVNALQNDMLLPTVFILVAFIVSFFSKNMTVVLLVALCVSNVIKYGTKIRVSEGLESLDPANDNEQDLLDEIVPEVTTKPLLKTPSPSGVTEPSKLDPAGIKLAKSTMDDLLNIQTAITKNVKNIEKSIINAEVVVNRIKEGLQPLIDKKKNTM